MANAAILHANLADAGILSVSTEAAGMPGSLLLNQHVRKRWRAEANSAYALVDLGSSLSLNTCALLGLARGGDQLLGASSTVRLRVSTADATGAAGDALDTTALTPSSAYYDPDYGAFVHAGAAITGRYVRFDIEDPDVDFVEAGRVVIGTRTAFTCNFTPGSARGWLDPSRRTKTEGQQTLLQVRPKARTFDLNFDFVTLADWETLIETIDRVNGLTRDLLILLDPEGSNVARDSIWGLLADLSPVPFTGIPDIVTRQYRIEERL